MAQAHGKDMIKPGKTLAKRVSFDLSNEVGSIDLADGMDMITPEKTLAGRVSFDLPDEVGTIDLADELDKVDPDLEKYRLRQRQVADLTRNLSIEHTYTGPLGRFRVLLNLVGEDNNQLTLRNTAAEPINDKLDAIMRHPIFHQHPRIELLGAIQDQLEIKCSFAYGQIGCEVYFDPASDHVLLLNVGQHVLRVQRIAEEASVDHVQPDDLCLLSPALWLISVVDGQPSAIEMLVRRRQYDISLREATSGKSAKRPSSSAVPLSSKKLKEPSGATVMVQGPSQSTSRVEGDADGPHTIVPKALRPQDLNKTMAPQTIVITTTGTQTPEYALRRLGRWVHSRTQADMFAAVLRDGRSEPSNVAVVMPRLPETGWNGLPKRELFAAIHLANSWWKRYNMLVKLQHPNLIACLGADLRYFSLHLEWPGVKTLAKAWVQDTYFTGGLHDAYTILADCAQALSYLSSHAIVHNNVTPWTIVYARDGDKGKAVLTDFDCAMGTTGTSSPILGNPCYIAPDLTRQPGSGYVDVWSLGIVMLFAMKITGLPGTPAHKQSLGENRVEGMNSWQKQVAELVSNMNTSADSEEDSELREIVTLMLSTAISTKGETGSVRISPTELGNRTKKWHQ